QLVEVGPLLAARGFRVIAIAPPGTGETPPLADPDAYLPSRLAQLVLSVADAGDIERFAFMGHSWGGTIGVHLAALHPDRIDALGLRAAGYSDHGIDQTRDELVHAFEADQAGFAFESWDAYFDWVRTRVRKWRPSLEPRYRVGMIEAAGRIVPRAEARAAAWAMYGVSVESPRDGPDPIAMPVLLLLAGGADPERFSERVPHAVVHSLDAGHDIVEDAPEETVELVANFLGRGR